MPLVTYLRCKHCGVEQTVIGPISIATYQQAGWQVSESQFYNPNGDHYCAEHRQKKWLLFCTDSDCWTGRDLEVTEIASMSPDDVLVKHWYQRCPDGHRLQGIEDRDRETVTWIA